METFGIPPSKPVGIIKDCIKESILDGVIHNNFEEAYELMIRKGKEIGLSPVHDLNKGRKNRSKS